MKISDTTRVVILASVASVIAWSAMAQNLVVNGGFEDPHLANWQPYVPGDTTLTGWTIDATPGGGVQHFTTNIFAATGSQNIQLTGGATYSEGGGVSQTITTVPGAFYIISLQIASRTGGPASGSVSFGSSQHHFSVLGQGVVSNVTFSIAAAGASTLLDIVSDDPDNATRLLIIDNVSVVQAVPGPVDPETSTVAAWQGAVAADGLSTSTITVTLTDSNSIPVPDKTVTLAHTSGPGTPTISTISDTTSGAGTATFNVSSTTPGQVEFTATDVTDGNLVILQKATVDFLVGSVANADTSTVSVSPASVVADGVATSTVTVTLKDASNNPVSGKSVTLTNTAGSVTPTITALSETTDGNGEATFAVASTKAGTAELTAVDVTDENIVLTQTATVEFTVGPVDAGTSTVVASPAIVPADNYTVSTITITLKDATGNGVPGKTVSLVQTAGSATPDLFPVSTTTDTNGVATYEVSSISVGDAEFTATDVTDVNLVITQKATVFFSSLVSWSGLAMTITDDSDVSTNGILRYAEHWGGVDATVNGVPFTAAQNNVVASEDPVSIDTLNETNGYPQGSLSTDYWNILRGKWYGAGPGEYVALRNLRPGHKYEVQIWSTDPRYGTTQDEVILPGFTLNIHDGQYGIGTFTALGDSQILATSGSGVLNAVQVRDLSMIALTRGPNSGQLTLRGYTDLPSTVVTWKTTTLTPPVTWIPIQTNSVSGGNFGFTIPQGTDDTAFFTTTIQ